jgi:tRNA A58 N-methylase Trm61
VLRRLVGEEGKVISADLQQRMLEELKSLLNPGGRIWVIEPKIHVTGKAFESMVGRIEAAGLEIVDRPEVAISRSVLLVVR